MTTYAWPQTAGWIPERFEMRLIPNAFTFAGPHSLRTEAIGSAGARWRILMDLPPDTSTALGAQREAFFDRLKGLVNLIAIGHQKRKVPQGTLRDGTAAIAWKNSSNAALAWINSSGQPLSWAGGAPAVQSAVAAGATIATLQTVPYATLLAGDHIGMAGQLVRVMANAVADAAGLLPFEFAPAVRAAIPAYTPAVWNYPTANFRLAADGVPVAHVPGALDGSSLELIEAT